MKPLPPNFLDIEQGTRPWFDARLGLVTSTRVADAIGKLKRKDGEAACRKNLRWEIVVEMLTRKPSEHYVSVWMEQGKEKEPLARAAYEIATGCDVRQVGFVLHERIARMGASPDGLVGDDGLVELKCPKTRTHLEYISNAVVPAEYQPQMLCQMACAGRQWCDFVSYDPDLPEALQVFIQRFPRDEQRIADMEAAVEQFLAEVDLALNQLRTAYQLPEVLAESLAKVKKRTLPANPQDLITDEEIEILVNAKGTP